MCVPGAALGPHLHISLPPLLHPNVLHHHSCYTLLPLIPALVTLPYAKLSDIAVQVPYNEKLSRLSKMI